MATQQFDKLNNMRSMSYEKYFGEMNLTESQKKRRIDIAEDLEVEIMFILSLVAVQETYSSINWNEIQELFENAYKTALAGKETIDSDLELYIKDMSFNLMESTKDNIDDEYTTSYDRTRYISENEADTIVNHLEYAEAMEQGYTKKAWLTMRDERVRHTHVLVDNKKIPIGRFFTVGNSLMLYPKDTSLGASSEEIINCRCSIKYSKD